MVDLRAERSGDCVYRVDLPVEQLRPGLESSQAVFTSGFGAHCASSPASHSLYMCWFPRPEEPSLPVGGERHLPR